MSERPDLTPEHARRILARPKPPAWKPPKCCGATNAHCALPPGVVYDTGTGCEKCGHPRSCHIWG